MVALFISNEQNSLRYKVNNFITYNNQDCKYLKTGVPVPEFKVLQL